MNLTQALQSGGSIFRYPLSVNREFSATSVDTAGESDDNDSDCLIFY